MNTIVIDCGASFVKGGLFAGQSMKRQMEVAAPSEATDSIFEPIKITRLLKIVREMIVELGKDEREVWLSICNEMHGFILTFENHEPYTEYISWQKEMGHIVIDGTSSVDCLRCGVDEAEIARTGMPLRAGLPSSNLLYLKRTGALSNGEKLRFYTLGDYVLASLSGKEPCIHTTNAAATGMYDLENGRWSEPILAMVSCGNIELPHVGDEELAFSLDGLLIHAWPTIGDQQAALLGAGLERMDDISFNLGTGAQVSVLRRAFEPGSGYQIRPFFYDLYLMTVPHIPSGRALNVFLRFFKDLLCRCGCSLDDKRLWEVLLQAENEYSDETICCDLSFFENAVTNTMRGSITNIMETSLTVPNLMHSIFRQAADNYLFAADRVCHDRGAVKRIVFSGGISRRIKQIRQGILDGFSPDTSYTVAENETLVGLNQYAAIQAKKAAQGRSL